MHVPVLKPLALASLLALLPLASALPHAGIVHGHGSGTHTYTTSGTCVDDANITVEYNAALRRILVVADSECVVPYWSLVGGCTGTAGMDIVCERTTASTTIALRFALDGSFSLRWISTGFSETLEGQLARTDA